MKRLTFLLLTLLASTSAAEGPLVGRYQLGGTERDGLILLDTASGRTWKYSREVPSAGGEPSWIPLPPPEKIASAAAAPPAKSTLPAQTPAEQPWIAPGPYKDKRPGGK